VVSGEAIDAGHLAHQREWSTATFGPGFRAGVVDHIRKELVEIEADPLDLAEWVDVIILGFDGAWRAGHEPQAIIDAIKGKQARNEARTWPDWRTMSSDKAIEHDRSADDATPPLVAAPPVPPVVPDSEPWPDCAIVADGLSSHVGSGVVPDSEPHCSLHVEAHEPGSATCVQMTVARSGSGVVPDKPALAPETCAHCFSSRKFCGIANSLCCQRCSHASVPAVTDDEAATDWPLIAAFLTATHGIPEDSQDDDDRGWAIEAIAGLRSAGFLIVHHTKET
jgi:hypothetical protein